MSKALTDITATFFALIRCGIGKEQSLPVTPTAGEWQELFSMAKKHTLAGITFEGIERIPQEQRPPSPILLQWYLLRENIRKTNAILNGKASAVSRKFNEEGFSNCILKGQGIAQLYPDPSLRTSGDIDIWIDGGCDKIIRYVRAISPDCEPTYHHVDFDILSDVSIELHYRPTWMYNPFANHRLQNYFTSVAKEQFTNITSTPEGDFPVATTQFNRIYILLHIYRHLFSEGIGIRQILDYYHVTIQEITPQEREEHLILLKKFGLHKFAGAISYVMQQMFALDSKHTLVPPNEKEGRFLMNEIMAAGNFGHHDTRYKATGRGIDTARLYNVVKRLTILFSHYPSETFWSPFFKVWHLFWRKFH